MLCSLKGVVGILDPPSVSAAGAGAGFDDDVSSSRQHCPQLGHHLLRSVGAGNGGVTLGHQCSDFVLGQQWAVAIALHDAIAWSSDWQGAETWIDDAGPQRRVASLPCAHDVVEGMEKP